MDTWRAVLVAALAGNAILGFAYRLYRYRRGGPVGDVIGQAVLGVLLAGTAVAVAADLEWARWPAVGYAALFGLVVMPLWVLAVLIPLRPGKLDIAFTVVYWALLAITGVAALAL